MTDRGTTININQELWENAKIHCIRKNITFKELIDTSLRKYLEGKEGVR